MLNESFDEEISFPQLHLLEDLPEDERMPDLDSDLSCPQGCRFPAADGFCKSHFRLVGCNNRDCKSPVLFTTKECVAGHGPRQEATEASNADLLTGLGSLLGSLTQGGSEVNNRAVMAGLGSKPPALPEKREDLADWVYQVDRYQAVTGLAVDRIGSILMYHFMEQKTHKKRKLLETIAAARGPRPYTTAQGFEEFKSDVKKLWADTDIIDDYKSFVALVKRVRHSGEKLADYSDAWEVLRAVCVEKGMVLTDWVSALMFISSANLEAPDMKAVLSAVQEIVNETTDTGAVKYDKKSTKTTHFLNRAVTAVKNYAALAELEGVKATKTYMAENEGSEPSQGGQDDGDSFPTWQQGNERGRGGGRGRGRGRGGAERGRGRGGGRNGFNADKTYRRCYNCVGGCSREGCTIPHVQPCAHVKDATAKFSPCACPCSNHLAHQCKHIVKEKKNPTSQPGSGAIGGATAGGGEQPVQGYYTQEEESWRAALGLANLQFSNTQMGGSSFIVTELELGEEKDPSGDDRPRPVEEIIEEEGIANDIAIAQQAQDQADEEHQQQMDLQAEWELEARVEEALQALVDGNIEGNEILREMGERGLIPHLQELIAGNNFFEGNYYEPAGVIRTFIENSSTESDGSSVREMPPLEDVPAEQLAQLEQREREQEERERLDQEQADLEEELGQLDEARRDLEHEMQPRTPPPAPTQGGWSTSPVFEHELWDGEARHVRADGRQPDSILPARAQVEAERSLEADRLAEEDARAASRLLEEGEMSTTEISLSEQSTRIHVNTPDTTTSTRTATLHHLPGADPAYPGVQISVRLDTGAPCAALGRGSVWDRLAPANVWAPPQPEPEGNSRLDTGFNVTDRNVTMDGSSLGSTRGTGSEPSLPLAQMSISDTSFGSINRSGPSRHPIPITNIGMTGSQLGAAAPQDLVYATAEGQEPYGVGLVDTACPRTVAGAAFIEAFMKQYGDPAYVKKYIKAEPSKRLFGFGGGEKRASLGKLTLPIRVQSRDGKWHPIALQTEVVAASFSLLVGLTFLKQAEAVIDVKRNEMKLEAIGGMVFTGAKLYEENTGHLSIHMYPLKEDMGPERMLFPGDSELTFWTRMEDYVDTVTTWDGEAVAALLETIIRQEDLKLDLLNQELEYTFLAVARNQHKQSNKVRLTEAEVIKLHHFWGHSHPEKVKKLITLAGWWNEDCQKWIDNLYDCEPCLLSKRRIPHPKIGLPRSFGFNQTVCLDLKENTKHKQSQPYILYMICTYSRYVAASFIPNKEARTVLASFLENWCKVFSPPKCIMSDCGREFLNTEFANFSRAFNVLQTHSAALSPHQNGLNERNHFLCDQRVDKMLAADNSLSPEEALSYAVMAHNENERVDGFSPNMLAIHKEVSMDALTVDLAATPGSLEEPDRGSVMMRAMENARLAKQAYLEVSTDKVLREVVKHKLYHGAGEQVQRGDWVWFRQAQRKTAGPGRVSTIDGKNLYVVMTGFQHIVNKDDVIMCKSHEAMLAQRPELVSVSIKERSELGACLQENMRSKSVCVVPNQSVSQGSVSSSPGLARVAAGAAGQGPADLGPDLRQQPPQAAAGQEGLPAAQSGTAAQQGTAVGQQVAQSSQAGTAAVQAAPNEISTGVELRHSEVVEYAKSHGRCKECPKVFDVHSPDLVEHAKVEHNKRASARRLYNPITPSEARVELVKSRAELVEVARAAAPARPRQPQPRQEPVSGAAASGQLGGEVQQSAAAAATAGSQQRQQPQPAVEQPPAQQTLPPVTQLQQNKEPEIPHSEQQTATNQEIQGKDSLVSASVNPNLSTSSSPASLAGSEAPGPSAGEDQSSLEDNSATDPTYLTNVDKFLFMLQPDQARRGDLTDIVDEVYAVKVPREEQFNAKSMAAKKQEIKDFYDFGVVVPVRRPVGAQVLPTLWLLEDKQLPTGGDKRKARLVACGNYELGKHNIEVRSPTVAKSSVKIMMMELARRKDFSCKISDIRRAYLQCSLTGRDIYMMPPREAEERPGWVWKLVKACYGLVDSALSFFTNYTNNLRQTGMEVVASDPAALLYFDDNSKPGDKVREASGWWCNHVDDGAAIGNGAFWNDIHAPMRDKMIFGTHESLPARYLGFRISRDECGNVEMSQDEYVRELREIEVPEGVAMDEEVGEATKQAFKSTVCKLQMLAISSRPDCMWEAKANIKHYDNTTKRDVVRVNKLLRRIKSEPAVIKFSDIGKMEDWVFLGFADASYNSEKDGCSSCGGQIVLLANRLTGNCVTLQWQSRGLRRVARSSFAAEAMSFTELVDMIESVKMFMAQAYGSRIYSVPHILATDCKDLQQSLLSLKQVQDKSVLAEVVALKQWIAGSRANTEIRLLASSDMIADGLTKGRKAAGTEFLREIITTGRCSPPGGLQVTPHPGQFQKLWVALNPWPAKTKPEDFESDWVTVQQRAPGSRGGAASAEGADKGCWPGSHAAKPLQ